MDQKRLTHLRQLEAESIHIIREVAAEFENPVMMYSIGKDSSVMLHLARKAFYPGTLPFPLLHVDTTWKFQAMYALREKAAREAGMDLIVHQNPDAKARGINPFDHGSALHTDMWKTEGLKQALIQRGAKPSELVEAGLLISPESGGRRPPTSLQKVDLPLPLAPSSATRSSLSSRRSSPRRIGRPS